MTEDEWVKKLNDLGQEIDEIAGSVHPSVAMALTLDRREKYRALAQSDKVTPNAVLSGAATDNNERRDASPRPPRTRG